MKKELEALKNSPTFVRDYTNGMQSLSNSGIFPVLRQMGVCQFGTATTVDQVALRGAWSKGFQDAIDTLFDFLELHIDSKTDASKVRMDFGSLRYAVENGLMTEEEANAVRRGQPITAK